MFPLILVKVGLTGLDDVWSISFHQNEWQTLKWYKSRQLCVPGLLSKCDVNDAWNWLLPQILLREILFYFCYSFTASSITPRCPVKLPNWGDCIMTAIENTKPYLAKGDFGEGFIVPKMEPLYIKRLGMVSHDVNTTISDLIVTGASDFKVTKIK